MLTRAQSRKLRTVVSVDLPAMPPPRAPHQRSEGHAPISPLVIPRDLQGQPPRSRPPSSTSTPYDYADGFSIPPASPLSFGVAGPSSASLKSFSSSSIPAAPQSRYEIDRLQLKYNSSREHLRIEREAAEAERVLYERELREQNEELMALRRQLDDRDRDETGKGKGKSFRR